MSKSTYDLINGGGIMTARSLRLAFDEKEWIDNKVKTLTNNDDDYPTTKLLTTELGKKAASTHTHTKSQITDFPTSITPSAHTHTKSNITDFPTEMTPSAHTHTKSNITDFPTEMTGTTLGLVKLNGSYTFTGTLNVPTPALA